MNFNQFYIVVYTVVVLFLYPFRGIITILHAAYDTYSYIIYICIINLYVSNYAFVYVQLESDT